MCRFNIEDAVSVTLDSREWGFIYVPTPIQSYPLWLLEDPHYQDKWPEKWLPLPKENQDVY